jgi:hypothetical protein
MDNFDYIFPEFAHPSELGQEFYRCDELPEAVNEPQFISFDCGACGEKHATFDELVKCFKAQQAAREIVAVVVA